MSKFLSLLLFSVKPSHLNINSCFHSSVFLYGRQFGEKQVSRRRRASESSTNSIEPHKSEDVTSSSTLPPNAETQVTSKMISSPIVNSTSFQEAEKILKRIIMWSKKRKFREKKQKIILEGVDLIHNALNAGCRLDEVFYSEENVLNSLREHPSFDCVRTYQVANRTIRELTGILRSPKVVAICPKPVSEKLHVYNKASVPVTILCSDVRDPGNLASILTIVAAVGCKQLLLMKGCVDVWERKVLHEANGAHFQIPIVNNIKWADIQNYIPKQSAFYIADSSSDIDIEDNQIYVEVDDENLLEELVVPKDYSILKYCDKTLTQPAKHETGLQPFKDEHLPCKLYSEVSFPNKELVLYVGGETEGINTNAENLANELGGEKIKLPLENGVDSLNVCVALSIMLYEIKRQFYQKQKNIIQ